MHIAVNMKAGIATVVSLSLALWGCLIGCMQPALANSQTSHESALSENIEANKNQPEGMADMETCHHSAGNSSSPHRNGKPSSDRVLSCCAFEVTVIQKWDMTRLQIVTHRDFVPSRDFAFTLTSSRGPAEFAQPVANSGRDTLLETSLLRI